MEYRANVQECERIARMSRNPQEKATWRQVAEHWRAMFHDGQAEPDGESAKETTAGE